MRSVIGRDDSTAAESVNDSAWAGTSAPRAEAREAAIRVCSMATSCWNWSRRLNGRAVRPVDRPARRDLELLPQDRSYRRRERFAKSVGRRLIHVARLRHLELDCVHARVRGAVVARDVAALEAPGEHHPAWRMASQPGPELPAERPIASRSLGGAVV